MTELAGFNWQLEIRDENDQLVFVPLDLISFSVNHEELSIFEGPARSSITADFECEVDHIFPDFNQVGVRNDVLHLKRRDDTGHYGVFRNCRMSSFNIMNSDYSNMWGEREIKRIEWTFYSQEARRHAIQWRDPIPPQISHVVDWRKSGF